MNIAEFGPDLFGVQAASAYYFHKDASEVNAAEGAFLGLMLPSPKRNFYSIYKNRNLSSARKKRLARVLRDRKYHEYISLEEYQDYLRFDYYAALDAPGMPDAGTSRASRDPASVKKKSSQKKRP